MVISNLSNTDKTCCIVFKKKPSNRGVHQELLSQEHITEIITLKPRKENWFQKNVRIQSQILNM